MLAIGMKQSPQLSTTLVKSLLLSKNLKYEEERRLKANLHHYQPMSASSPYNQSLESHCRTACSPHLPTPSSFSISQDANEREPGRSASSDTYCVSCLIRRMAHVDGHHRFRPTPSADHFGSTQTQPSILGFVLISCFSDSRNLQSDMIVKSCELVTKMATSCPHINCTL